MGKTAIIGSRGSIGKRYSCIFDYLGEPYIGYDVCGPFNKEAVIRFVLDNEITRALICVPTDVHYDYCRILSMMGVDYMVEKPLTKSPQEAEELANLAEKHRVNSHIVCNYKILLDDLKRHGKNQKKTFTEYNYFNTGKDGLLWDCCQLIMLNPEIEIYTDSPIWILKCGDSYVDYRMVELSYLTMIRYWLDGNLKMLWDIHDAVEMVTIVLDRVMNERTFWDSSPQLQ